MALLAKTLPVCFENINRNSRLLFICLRCIADHSLAACLKEQVPVFLGAQWIMINKRLERDLALYNPLKKCLGGLNPHPADRPGTHLV